MNVGRAMTADYVARQGDVRRDRDAVIEIWRGNLGREDRLAAKYDWFYLNCPMGQPLLELLHHVPSGKRVGVAAAGPRRMLVSGSTLSAGLLVDLAVATEHRSLGPALTLQKTLMTAAQERFDLVYGFPNPKAAAVFKRVGYTQLGELVRYAALLRYGDHVGRVLKSRVARPLGWMLDGFTAARLEVSARRPSGARWRSHWIERADAQIDALWSRSEHGDAPIAPRDTTAARWRFDDSPLPKTRYLYVHDAQTDELAAWFACQVEGETLHVRDFWSIDAATGTGRPFFRALLRAARKDGHAVVSLEFAGPPDRRGALLDAGFIPRTRRPIFGLWKNGAVGGNDRSQIHLTSADEDE